MKRKKDMARKGEKDGFRKGSCKKEIKCFFFFPPRGQPEKKKKGAVKKMGILKTDFSSQKSSNMDIDIHTAVHLWLNIL